MEKKGRLARATGSCCRSHYRTRSRRGRPSRDCCARGKRRKHRDMRNELPEAWESVKLGDITSKVGSGATPRGGSESYETQGIPLIRSMNVRFEGFTTRGLAFLS